MAEYPGTIAALKTQIFRKFFRTKPDAQTQFDSQVQTWINELARAFRFWFLDIRPGHHYDWQTTPVTLSATVPTRLAGEWVDRGWMVIKPGVRSYTFYAPFEDQEAMTGSSWWDFCQANKVYFVKIFNGDGIFQYDLPSLDSEGSLTNQCRSNNGGKPAYYTWETSETRSTIHFHPTPTEYCLAAIKFSLDKPPIYEDDMANQHNRFLTFAPRLLEYYALIELAEFFDEPNIKLDYMKRLYGDPPQGLDLAIQQQTGLIGDLVRQTRQFNAQQIEQFGRYRSLKEATGRGVYPRSRRSWDNPRGWYY